MILAAAAVGEGKNVPPPPELELAWQIARTGTLQKDGGLEDQPAGLMRRCAVAYNAYEAFRSRRAEGSGDWPAWVRSHPQHAKIIAMVDEMRRDGPS